jgi:hypothetical protein
MPMATVLEPVIVPSFLRLSVVLVNVSLMKRYLPGLVYLPFLCNQYPRPSTNQHPNTRLTHGCSWWDAMFYHRPMLPRLLRPQQHPNSCLLLCLHQRPLPHHPLPPSTVCCPPSDGLEARAETAVCIRLFVAPFVDGLPSPGRLESPCYGSLPSAIRGLRSLCIDTPCRI